MSITSAYIWGGHHPCCSAPWFSEGSLQRRTRDLQLKVAVEMGLTNLQPKIRNCHVVPAVARETNHEHQTRHEHQNQAAGAVAAAQWWYGHAARRYHQRREKCLSTLRTIRNTNHMAFAAAFNSRQEQAIQYALRLIKNRSNGTSPSSSSCETAQEQLLRNTTRNRNLASR